MQCFSHLLSFVVVVITVLPSVLSIDVENNSPTVLLAQGKLKGTFAESRNGRQYAAFLGIPYGSSQQRFQAAKTHQGWGDTLYDATDFGPMCYQSDFGGENVIGSDDCLNVNVYSPTLKADTKLPVMVFIYGGAFKEGANQLYDAKYFMDEDIVLITVNYRLGIFGFLSTGDKELSGNLGMKDQVLALKWVQENAANFSGDPKKVTIFGESAGAASVGYHLLSPLSSGLFHRAISFSGSPLCPWALQRKPLKNAKIIAKHLDCPVESNKELVACLRTKSPEDLVNAQNQFVKWHIFPSVVLAPVIEKESEDAFLSQSPYEILASGKVSKVPYMIGITQDEGLIIDIPIIKNENLTAELNTDWLKIAPVALEYQDVADEEDLDEISERVRGFYFEDEEIGELSWASLTEMFSDRYFNHGAYRAAKLHARQSRVYPFMFSFPGDYSLIQSLYGIKDQYGVAHSDELQYLFNGVYNSPEYNNDTEIREFSQNFVKLLASFADSGKPTSTWGPEKHWKPIAPQKSIEWYQIDIKTNVWEDDLETRVAFWEGLPIKELKNEKVKIGKDEL